MKLFKKALTVIFCATAVAGGAAATAAVVHNEVVCDVDGKHDAFQYKLKINPFVSHIKDMPLVFSADEKTPEKTQMFLDRGGHKAGVWVHTPKGTEKCHIVGKIGSYELKREQMLPGTGNPAP